MTPDLRCAPTPTPIVGCRKKPPKRWGISWHRCCSTGEQKGPERTNILSGPFRSFRRVGHGVGQSLTHILTRTVFPQKVTKPAEIIRFPPVCGGDTQTRTGGGAFAELCLTTWLCRPMDNRSKALAPVIICMEQVTRLELATSTLARWRSTR